MWIQVRTMDGRQSCRLDGLSKLTKIEDLRKQLVDKFNAPVVQQRLFFRGKQLEDGHSLFDYNVGLNEIIQIIVKQPDVSASLPPKQGNTSNTKEDKENKIELVKNGEAAGTSEIISQYYKVGDLVDGKDLFYGAWFEAKIIEIRASNADDKPVLHSGQSNSCSINGDSKVDGDDLIYRIVFEDYEDCEDPMDATLQSIRPRARKLLKLEDVGKGDRVMVNFNIDEPTERGFWYDCVVTDKKMGRTTKQLIGTIIIGPDQTQLENCKVIFTDEIFAIETNVVRSEICSASSEEIAKREKTPKCSHCKDIPTRKCKNCSCHACGGKDAPEKQIMCDECDFAYHLWCLKPPLESLPEDDWYCPECKNDTSEVVGAGEHLKKSNKKSKMASARSSSTRDWGKGMACVGRTRECTLVPPNHFGSIPGVEVGTLWKFRVQVSESGVHRPHVAGIHGREGDGAFSLVLSGGYEDDLDEGEEFKYTGSGGRDLSGNKRCAEQSCDQTLTRMNRALAINCNAPLNKNGTEAKNWKEGKPVRVVRNCKGSKHSKYSPEEGNRYDGIYKVVKYWPEKGKSGFLVWRYLLRRDDPTPAPWTKEGKKRIKDLGLTMQYPEGYLESLTEKEKATDGEKPTAKKRKKMADNENTSDEPKKKKKTAYTISSEIQKFIDEDTLNKKLWNECSEVVAEGSQNFLRKVEDIFSCICCQEVVFQPITTTCSHNICKPCLERSFKAEVYSCPMCRQELEKSALSQGNNALKNALRALFPGYEAGR
ncbi:hypothetical protein JTE90_002296 [Oedothorax gibbosus]|uniref:RING-type E3 ubiquitin transferase n=1 Tax=Oedothorax gibbosus TaxID=931172 RepID=A0AAV6UJ77_9ARAC|nr:hypothetical protein JTE90_002296 [Oedothorax gibbosus]